MSDKLFCGLSEKTVEEYTPLIAAGEVIITLRVLVEITQGHGKGAFFKRYGDYFLKNRLHFSDSDVLEANTPVFTDQSPELWARERNSFYICAAYVFALEAIDEDKAGRVQHAWVLATQANVYMGSACGSDSLIVMPRIVKTDQGRQNKNKSYERYENIKATTLKYYQDNITTFSSYTDAGEKITDIKDAEGKKKYKVSCRILVKKWIPEFYKDNPSFPRPTKKRIKKSDL